MSDDSKGTLVIGGLVIAAIISAGVGLAFTGSKTRVQHATENTANLPATNEKVRSNSQSIKENRETFRNALEKQSERHSKALSEAVNLVRAEINRRETETIKYIDTLDTKKRQRIDDLKTTNDQRFDRIEDVGDANARESRSNSSKIDMIIGWKTTIKPGS